MFVPGSALGGHLCKWQLWFTKSTPVIASQWNSLLIEYQPISAKLSTNSWKSYLLFGAVQLYFLGNMTGHTISTLNTVHLKQLTKKNTIPLHQTDDVLEPLGGVQCVPLGTGRCEWNKRIVLRLPSQLIRFNSSGELCLLDRQTDPLSSFLLLVFFIWCSLALTGHTV